MKKSLVRRCAAVCAVMALSCSFLVSSVHAADAPKKEKGPALQQLEGAAGKKIEDVKVPDVPKPTPAGSSYDVNKSSSSYDVNTSSGTKKGK